VKITGMSPDEMPFVDLRVAERSYYMKAPWKRIVVILAGPGVNLALAFALFAAVLMSGNLDGQSAIGNLAPSQQTLALANTSTIYAIDTRSGAAGHLRLRDRIIGLDGRRVSGSTLAKRLQVHRCSGGALVDGCPAASPAHVTVVRGGRTLTLTVLPHYSVANQRMLLGVGLGRPVAKHFGLVSAVGTSIGVMWDLGTSTVTHYFDALISSKVRAQTQSAIGIAQDTQQAIARGPGFAFVVLGLISLVLAVVNLFPFLPLDGGHVVWSLAEKLRGRRVSLATMWRFSSVGIVLLGFLVISGISNDVSRLSG
jgi:regulator of sigma E protease